MANADHETRLRGSAECWNRWRTTYGGAPDLSAAVFENVDFTGVNLSYVNFQGALFRECKFTVANFEGAQLQRAEFSGISAEQHVDFSRAKMNGVKFVRSKWRSTLFRDTYLRNAWFEEVEFDACDFSDASLTYAKFLDCAIRECNFRDANLLGCCFEPAQFGMPVSPNKMSNCVFTNTNLAGADLRGVVGYQFDHTNIQGAIIPPRAMDDWSVLRRTYTGSALIFNLIFLLLFFAPVIAKTIFWMEISRTEAQLPATLSVLNELPNELAMTPGEVGHNMADALRRAVGEVPILREGGSSEAPLDFVLSSWLAGRLMMDPGPAGRLLGTALESSLAGLPHIESTGQLLDRLIDQLARSPANEAGAMADALRRATTALPSRLPHRSSLVISVVLGLDVSWEEAGISGVLSAGAGVLLIVYNAARGALTFLVSRLRDEEQITAHTPRRGATNTGGLMAWMRSLSMSVRGHLSNLLKRPWGRLRPSWPFHLTTNWTSLIPLARKRTGVLMQFPNKFRENYRWMIGPHRMISKLAILAYGMTAIHLYTLLIQTVVVSG